MHGEYSRSAKLPAPGIARRTKIAGLRAICKSLAIPLQPGFLQNLFAARVISPFAKASGQWLYPQSCAYLQSGHEIRRAFDFAMALGADKFATGHYASLAQNPHDGAVVLKRAQAAKKGSKLFSGAGATRHFIPSGLSLAAHEEKYGNSVLRNRGFNPPDEAGRVRIISALWLAGVLPGFFWLAIAAKTLFTPGAPGLPSDPERQNNWLRHKGLWNYSPLWPAQRPQAHCPLARAFYVICK